MHIRWAVVITALRLLQLSGHALATPSPPGPPVPDRPPAPPPRPPVPGRPPLPPPRPKGPPALPRPQPPAEPPKPPRVKFDTDPNPEFVFRGESVSWDEAKKRGGFFPRTSYESPGAYELWPVQLQRERGATIDTAYVSTSYYFEVARSYPSRNNRFVYRIRGTPNFVDMPRSLGQHIVVDEVEFAALGGISWKQVHGWIDSADIRDDTIVDELSNTRFDRLQKEGKYVLNPDYDPAFDAFRAGGGAPQLVGFPEGHPARNQEPWKAFQDKSAKEYAIEFMDENGKGLGWRGQFPLLKPAEGTSEIDKPTGEKPGKPSDETLGLPPCPRTKRFLSQRQSNCIPQPHEASHNQDKAPTAVETAGDGELMAMANQRSKESFDSLLLEFGYGSVVKQGQLYNELNARLPEFSTPRPEKIAGLTTKIGEGALAVAGLALYGKAVADVFSSDASVLDKAAVVTSILPGIGCAVQLADDAERGHGHVDVAQTALCSTEDALSVSGFWEIALAMQVGQELSNWIKAENERDKLWDMELLAKKTAEGWLDNAKRLINHLRSDEFIANATTKLSTYQILTLFQASQLTGDLHAAHKVLSENATMPNAQQGQSVNDDISALVQPELKRQICSTMAESKYQLHMKLEAVALNHMAKLEREFRNHFLDEWLKAATTPAPILGITLPDWSSNTKLIHEEIDRARNTPLPLYEDEVKRAIKEAIERIKTPAPCQCVQGKKGGKCEFGDCQSPSPQTRMDAGGRIYATRVRSIEMAKRMRLTEGCQALFTTCQVPGSTSEIGRPLWCTPGK
ncbi:Heat Labile Enterotoxin Type Iib [Metarhizium acridum CQMa 102]|uniref:Heat Labile Enterotoxin Type Iib n=1 Tax=Metarhizium acridum (strain CQMa 102) TaxID=655827 RepID=E9DRF6_METAQ|nr:Heat Labile Enterotoxin Type Iib [Metarhizium acridum CQMa 102]EFY93834.1 Heat Labile Enterotoxin Type Iib [Metarhizium acridum CQMa 102]